MLEQEFWLRVAEVWRQPQGSGDDVYVTVLTSSPKGLCNTIKALVRAYGGDDVLYESAASMLRKVRDLPKDNTGYAWPTTLQGAAQRVAYCEAQAKHVSD